MLQRWSRRNSTHQRGPIGSSYNRAILLLPCLFGLSTAVAQPEPDMDASGCVDLLDVALFQNDFGRIDIPGIAACDFHVDGYCDYLDYEVLASVLGGPLCTCANDSDCPDSDPCTTDRCAGVECLHLGCPNQDHNDADCIREYCTPAGCAAADEPNSSPCDDGYDCTLSDLCLYGYCLSGIPVPPCCAVDSDCDDGYSCTDDVCFGVECQHVVNCTNQDDSDADCIHEYCTVAGCVAGEELDWSPCEDGDHCTLIDACQSGQCLPGIALPSCCLPAGSNGCSADVKCCSGGPGLGVPCIGGTCCLPLGWACVANTDCCDAGADCLGGRCCLPAGSNGCSADVECCSGGPGLGVPCIGGTCCLPLGWACVANTDCCDDGVPCTDQSCVVGQCVVVSVDSRCPNRNNPDDDCVLEHCTPSGCVLDWEPDGSPCQDNSPCTSAERCQQGYCVFGVSDDTICGNSDDTDADCTHAYCTPNGCVTGDEEDGSICEDGVPCTAFDYCNAGQCLRGTSICGNDNDADADCIRADCDPFDGCVLAIEPDGSPCEDGIACTGSDFCTGGQCYGGILYDFLCPNQDYCDDDCIQYYCDPGQGCVPGAEFESAPCWDFFCALNDRYSACTASGFCECRAQPPPDFGCP